MENIDQAAMLSRLRAALPATWFPATVPGEPSQSPVLDALLGGDAATWTFMSKQLDYIGKQARIGTATDVFLDICAREFIGPAFVRKANETDGAFRARVKANLTPERVTRHAFIKALIALTGHEPIIFEPGNPLYTGGYGAAGGMGYGAAGKYGSMLLPNQAFLTVYRPPRVIGAAANVDGYGDPIGGYGIGALEYASSAAIAATTTDAEIYALIASLSSVASIAWTKITDIPPVPGDRISINFILDSSELSDGFSSATLDGFRLGSGVIG